MIDKTLSFTRRSLAEALDNVRHLSDLGPEMIAEQVFAASAQQPALTVPEGWKLVPVDPTEEILDAICLAKNMTRRGLAVVMNMQELESIYRAMLAAAPAAPVAQEPVAWQQMAADAHSLLRRVADSGFDDDCVGAIVDWLHDQPVPPAAEQPDTVKLAAALKPFADAFEATGLPQYKGADEEHAEFLDENQITPVRGITMRQFRRAWEVLSGKSALLGKEGEA